jgi:hypothetical protein
MMNRRVREKQRGWRKRRPRRREVVTKKKEERERERKRDESQRCTLSSFKAAVRKLRPQPVKKTTKHGIT